MVILLVAMRMTVQTLVGVNRLTPAVRDKSSAIAGARNKLEEMRGQDFPRLFALYNADPADDPGGAGTAPGAGFQVSFLQPWPGDADGLVGRIEFPTIGGELREDVNDRDLGMPRDLNEDDVQDSLDHAGDYVFLPVRIRVEWTSKSGNRSFEAYTAFTAP